MKAPFRFLLYVVPVLLVCGLAMIYLLSVKEQRACLVMPEVIDSLAYRAERVEVNEPQTPMYTPLYMGKWQKRILIHRSEPPYEYYYNNFDGQLSDYREAEASDLELLLDTSRFVTGYREEFKNGVIQAYQTLCYPAMLANLSGDTLNVGYGSVMPFTQEALDSSGKWRPVEKPYIYLCGMGLGGIRLPPGEIAIVPVAVYQGTYRTRLRLRYGKLCSREYRGSIHPGQLIFPK